jgi:sugar lactone lactonase YvrE
MTEQDTKTPGRGAAAVLIGVLVLAAAGAGVYVVARSDFFGDSGSGLGREFRFDISDLRRIDPKAIGYRPTLTVALAMKMPRAVAVGPQNRVYVAGDTEVRVFEPDGREAASLPVGAEPRCLAVSADGRIYVGLKDRVQVMTADGKRVAEWKSPGPKTWITSIAVQGETVAVADFGTRSVHVYDTAGSLVRTLGGRKDGQPVFNCPSPYFDVAFGVDGLLRIVNPGHSRIEVWTAEGDREFAWGTPTTELEGFSPCCNPSHIAILADGRVATSEKGIARVKVYRREKGPRESGVMDTVVAGPEALGEAGGFDVAADGKGRVLLLDTDRKEVRVFERLEGK